MTLDISLRQRAIPDGSMRYFAWLYTASEHREVVGALFVLESELRDTARTPHDVAHIRLQWWREEVERLNRSNAQHPATVILQNAKKPSADFSALEQLIVSCAQDIAHSTYSSDAELQQYFDSYGSLARTAASLLVDAPTSQVLEAATKLGAFIREAETLRDIRVDVRHGHLYLPLIEVDQLNVEYESLASEDWPAPFIVWLTNRAKKLLEMHRTLIQALLAGEKAQLRTVVVLAAQHAKLIEQLISNPDNFKRRTELGTLTKVWTAWKAARNS